jgi:FkbM family methyltransferase
MMAEIRMADNRRTVTLNGRVMTLVGHESIQLVDLLADGQWEPHLFDIFDRYLRSDRSYVDVGAFIGASVMHGAQLARHCYAIEPNPLVYRYLVENTLDNVAIRDRVTRFEGCIWDRNGTVRLSAPVKPFGSTASLQAGTACASWPVQAVTFESFLRFFGVTDLNFIKMDIEGAESVVLPQMADYLRRERPTVLVSVHAFGFDDRRAQVAGIVDALEHYRYLYLRDGTRVDPAFLRRCEGMESPSAPCSDILATDESWPA